MAKRWFYTFKTFQGHTCEVDICDETFNGTPIELNKDVPGSPGCPSDNPVVIEEDSSDNLLENVRIKTGYLNFIELTDGGLKDMFPLTNNQFEVFIFINKPANVAYDSDDADDYIIFHGYIQAQSFRNDYLSNRTSIKLPIQSMMGLIGDYNTEGSVSLDGNFADLAPYYKYLVFPDLKIEHEGQLPKNLLLLKISRLIMFPYNDNYNYGIHSRDIPEPSPTVPIKIHDFVKMVCDCLGLISHDVGNSLVFTKTGFTDKYLKYVTDALNPSAGVIIGSGDNVIGLSQFCFASDKNKISYVMPLKSVRREWKEFVNPYVIDFSLCKLIDGVLKYKGYDIQSNIWSSSTSASFTGLRLKGRDNQEILQLDDAAENLFRCVFEAPDGQANYLHIEAESSHFNPLSISLYSNGKWYNFNPSEQTSEETWVNSPTYQVLAFNNGVCDQLIESNGTDLIVYFHDLNSQVVQYDFKKIQIELRRTTNKYTSMPLSVHEEIVPLNNNSVEEKTVDYNLMKYSDRGFEPDWFERLSISQRNLHLILRKTAAISELDLLIGKFAIDANDQNNRVISTKHNVRDDIFELQVMGNQYF